MLCIWGAQRPGWVLPGASLDLNFSGGTYFPAPVNSALTISRAQTVSSYAQWADGHFSAFAADTLRLTDQGLLIEQGSTNKQLWSNDWTNAAYVKVNVTAAMDQTGPDNVANSASSLTATANGGTILQTVTEAATANTASVYLKRITGTGTITLVQNGASGTTATLSANAWTLNTVTATQLNPAIGIIMATSGDKIAVWGGQFEALTFATSPIPTTTIAVARPADNIELSGSAVTAAQSTAGWARIIAPLGVNSVGTATLLSRQMGNANDIIFQANSTTTVRSLVSGSGFSAATIGSAGTWAAKVTAASTWDGAGIANAANAGTVASSATPFTASPSPDPFLGSRDGSTANTFISNYISRLTFGSVKLSNTQLQALAQ